MPSAASRDFPDHFSAHAGAYAAHRPTYPPELGAYIAGLAPGRGLAWDAGCGSGQMSLLLADSFERVIATDASPEQIARAPAHPRVEFVRERAEDEDAPWDRRADAAVAAQAAHWFDLPAYYARVRRRAAPGSVIALVSYGLTRVDAAVDAVVAHWYDGELAPYWPAQRRHVDDGYRALPFPFEELTPPAFGMRADWTLPQFLGYLNTWSAVRALERAKGAAAVEAFEREVAAAWGGAPRRLVSWPLALRVGRVS